MARSLHSAPGMPPITTQSPQRTQALRRPEAPAEPPTPTKAPASPPVDPAEDPIEASPRKVGRPEAKTGLARGTEDLLLRQRFGLAQDAGAQAGPAPAEGDARAPAVDAETGRMERGLARRSRLGEMLRHAARLPEPNTRESDEVRKEQAIGRKETGFPLLGQGDRADAIHAWAKDTTDVEVVDDTIPGDPVGQLAGALSVGEIAPGETQAETVDRILDKANGRAIGKLELTGHGREGEQVLNGGERLSLTADNLDVGEWARLRGHFGEDGRIELGGCQVAAGEGPELLRKLARATGVPVTAGVSLQRPMLPGLDGTRVTAYPDGRTVAERSDLDVLHDYNPFTGKYGPGLDPAQLREGAK